jgi:ketosteroid isomerase-like protein
MKRTLACSWAVALSLTVVSAAAADPADALAVIRKFNGAANGDDRAAYASYCAPDITFVDHVPPYVFRGPTACQDEWDAVLAWITREKIAVTDYSSLGDPAFVDETPDRVYAVYPATAALSRRGKRQIERGLWTFVVRREPAGWRIASVTWSTLAFAPAPAARAARRK